MFKFKYVLFSTSRITLTGKQELPPIKVVQQIRNIAQWLLQIQAYGKKPELNCYLYGNSPGLVVSPEAT